MSYCGRSFKFDDENICFTSGRYNSSGNSYNKTFLGKFNYNTNEIYWTETNPYMNEGRYEYSAYTFNTNKLLTLGGTNNAHGNEYNTYSIGTFDKTSNIITWSFLENDVYIGGNTDTLFINGNFYTFGGVQYSRHGYISDIYKGVYHRPA